MRICLLTNQELDGDLVPDDDWLCDPRPFIPEAEWHVEVLEKSTAVSRLMHLARMEFDVFFNLCDGAFDEPTPGIEVVQALERLRVPFTGANSLSYEPSRVAMKKVCRALGIDTPAYVMALSQSDVDRAGRDLAFPMIVKHPSSYASVDLTEASRVTNVQELSQQAALMIEKHAAALIEEFVEGVEYTVLVAENPADPTRPVAYQPVQYRFPEGQSFKHHDMKWVDYEEMKCFPVEDRALDENLRQVAADFFRGLNFASFGRVDIRVNGDGRPFILEINANCGVFYEPEDAGAADLCLLNDPAGHEGFARLLVEAAIARHRDTIPPWTIRYGEDAEFGLYATRAVANGERLVRFDDTPHTIVTVAGVEKAWSVSDRSRFDRDAWPLTEDLWVTWSQDAEEWRTPRHSCDPTGWLEGLDVIARREVQAGDEITLDYATFHNERMPSFICHCGSSQCRGTIRGTDFLEGFVTKYGSHVSDYVKTRRAGSTRSAGVRTVLALPEDPET